MERSEEYEPIILDLQKSKIVPRSKRYLFFVVVAVALVLGTFVTFAALYYPKISSEGRSVIEPTPVPASTPAASVAPTPVPTLKKSEDPTPTPEPPMTEAMGKLSLYSFPSNAEVVIAGERLGYTPLIDYELKPGTYIVKFSHEGTVSEHKIAITAGETSEYTHRFEGYGSLYIRTTRSGSDIYVNGELAGQSPLIVEGLAPGTYTITAQKRGYATAERTATLKKGERQEMLITIKRLGLTTQPGSRTASTPTPRPLHPSERLQQ